MKAYVRGDADSLNVQVAEVSPPQVGDDEVLIEVKAFGVGLHDRFFIPAEATFPYVIGTEGAGVIVETGEQVSDFAVGDRVIFTTTLQPQGGSWAEYAAAPQTALIRLPGNLGFSQGAALPVAGKTALECMRGLELEAGDCLFIAGASGAIGTLVIQMAAASGVSVVASASEKNHAYMESLGADKAVDYRAPGWPQAIRAWAGTGVDAALAIQPGTGVDSMEVVKNGGRLITVSGDSDRITPVRDIAVRQIEHRDTRQEMLALVGSIASGRIHVEIEKAYPFDEALDALAKTETRHARGKVVVKVSD